MRSRLFVACIAMVVASFSPAGSQEPAPRAERYSDGLVAGDYVRVGAGIVSPVSPQGSLRDWDRGKTFSLMWENWQAGSGGIGRVGFGIGVNYGMLPLDEQQFISEFVDPLQRIPATSATASDASVLQIQTSVRIRIPSRFIMPSVSLAFGYINFHPGTIHYTTASGPGTTSQQRRYGGDLTIGGGLDKTIVARLGVYGEALYTYGFTSLGQGIATPSGTCPANGCDPLKNTKLGTIRGGLRVRVGR